VLFRASSHSSIRCMRQAQSSGSNALKSVAVADTQHTAAVPYHYTDSAGTKKCTRQQRASSSDDDPLSRELGKLLLRKACSRLSVATLEQVQPVGSSIAYTMALHAACCSSNTLQSERYDIFAGVLLNLSRTGIWSVAACSSVGDSSTQSSCCS
jgi:hypothetical protein